MGLFSARNLSKARGLLEKNRHKVGDYVGKAGEQLDKATKGKSANVTAKATDAARKYSAGGTTHTGIDDPPPPAASPSPDDA